MMKNIKQVIFIIGMLLALNVKSQKSSFELGIGRGGSDGIEEQSIYDLTYKREITKRFWSFVQYKYSAGEIGRFGNEGNKVYIDTRYIGSENDGDNPINEKIVSTSLLFAAQLDVVQLSSSKLYILGGFRYDKSRRSVIYTSGSDPDLLGVILSEKKTFEPEFGIGYQKIISTNYLLGGRFLYGPCSTSFGASIVVGVVF